jgi:hypothetical protein
MLGWLLCRRDARRFAAMPSSQVTSVSWSDLMAYDKGFDTVSCALFAGGVVDTKNATPVVSTPGQQTTLQLTLVENSSDLAESMNVSVQASMDMGVYGGDAKATFAASRSVNSSSVFFVASVVVSDKTEQYSSPDLAQMALIPAAASEYTQSLIEFRQKYGDSFVTGIEYGGELYCVLEITTASEEDKESLTASVSGHAEEFSGSASFTGAIDTLSKNRNVNVWIYKSGGLPVGVDSQHLTVDDFINMVGGFAGEIAKSPYPVAAIITPYDELAQIPSSTDPFEIDQAEQLIASFGQTYLQYRDALADLRYMLDNHWQFIYPPVIESEVQKVIATVTTDQTKVAQAIDDLASKPTPATVTTWSKAKPWPQADQLEASLPQRLQHLPTSASDLMQMYPKIPDGDYDIYLDGKLENRVTLHCVTSGGGAAQYISLVETAGGSNQSHWPASPPGFGFRKGTDMTTAYTKISFDTETKTVDVTDTRFATTSGGPLTDTMKDINDQKTPGGTYSYAPYATASAYNFQVGNERGEPFGTANVDLRGTPFSIDPSVTFPSTEFSVITNAQQPTDNTRKVINLRGGGYAGPGTAQPSPDLMLVLDGSQQTPTTAD